MKKLNYALCAFFLSLSGTHISLAQTFTDLPKSQQNAVNGLLPLSQVPTTDAKFWDGNRNQTWAISNGKAGTSYGTPTATFEALTPYSSTNANVLTSQAQAIYDAPYTRPNLYQLADGFGTKLGAVYQKLAPWSNAQPYKDTKQEWGAISPNVTNLIWYTGAMVRNDNMAARQILGSGSYDNTNYSSTVTNAGGKLNIYGQAYSYVPTPQDKTIPAVTTSGGLIYPVGSDKTNPQQINGQPIDVYNSAKPDGSFAGNPRPFEVFSAKNSTWGQSIPTYYANNYNTGASNYNSNWAYLITEPGVPAGSPQLGIDDQEQSSSYASGHAAYGWYGGLLMGMLVPERFQEMNTRAAENAVGRVVLGAHWATDVVGSRTLAYYEIAQEMANSPDYLSIPSQQNNRFFKTPDGNPKDPPHVVNVSNYQTLFNDAYTEMRKSLETECAARGQATIAACAQGDQSRFNNKANNQAYYTASLTMGLPVVNPTQPTKFDFKSTAETRNAGYLLQTRFPYLSLDQRADVITSTQLSGGGFLDNGTAFGRFSRINLVAAGNGYGSFDAPVEIAMDPSDTTLTASQKIIHL